MSRHAPFAERADSARTPQVRRTSYPDLGPAVKHRRDLEDLEPADMWPSWTDEQTFAIDTDPSRWPAWTDLVPFTTEEAR